MNIALLINGLFFFAIFLLSFLMVNIDNNWLFALKKLYKSSSSIVLMSLLSVLNILSLSYLTLNTASMANSISILIISLFFIIAYYRKEKSFNGLDFIYFGSIVIMFLNVFKGDASVTFFVIGALVISLVRRAYLKPMNMLNNKVSTSSFESGFLIINVLIVLSVTTSINFVEMYGVNFYISVVSFNILFYFIYKLESFLSFLRDEKKIVIIFIVLLLDYVVE
jgi:hypothetical protein